MDGRRCESHPLCDLGPRDRKSPPQASFRPRIRTVLFGLLIGGGAVLALPYVLIGGAVAYESGGEYLARTAFESSAWQDSALVFGEDPVRIRMVDASSSATS